MSTVKFLPVAHDASEDLWTPRYHVPFVKDHIGFRNVPEGLWKQLDAAYSAYGAASDAIDEWLTEVREVAG